MKKVLLLTFLVALSTGLFAQKFKIESGKLDFLQDEKVLDVQFTYDNTKVGKELENDYVARKSAEADAKEKGKGKKWEEAWQSDKEERFGPKFVELFNKSMATKSPSISTGGNYTMVVNADFIEPGFNVGIARKNASVNLMVKFINNTTGDIAAVVSIGKSSANDFMGTDFDSAYRIQESFAKAGRELAKFLISKAKLK